jgi:hypothetical protein
VLIISEKTHTTDFIRMPGVKPQTAQNDGPTQEQQAAQKKAESESKQQYLDKTGAQTQGQAPTNQPVSAGTTLGVTASQSDSTVTILTNIRGVPSGNCTLTITNGSRSTEQTAQVIYQPEFSSCAGFSLPVSSVGPGVWNITVKVTPSTGGAVQQTTSLEVKV